MKALNLFFLFGFIMLSVCVSVSDAINQGSFQTDEAFVDLSEITHLDLATAQKIALKGNPSLAAAKARILQAQARVRQAVASYLPTFNATAAVTHLQLSNNEFKRNLLSARLLDPQAHIDDPEDYYDAGISARWLLFDGFAREYTVKRNKQLEKQQSHAYDDVERFLLSSLSTVYYNAQLAKANLTIADADETFNERQVTEAELRWNAGTGSRSDILNFKVQMNAARSRSHQYQKEYDGFLTALAALMGGRNAFLSPSLRLAELSPENDTEMALPDSKNMIAEAFKNRPDLKQKQFGIRQAQSFVSLSRAEFYPNINLVTSINGNRANNEDFEQDDFEFSVGLNVSYNLFSGGASRAKLKEAKWQLVEAKKDFANLTVTVAAEVNDALATLNLAQNEIRLQRMNAALVEENRNLVAKEYAAGQGSLVRLNEAQRDLVAAQSKLVLALVSLRQAWQNLNSVTGKSLLTSSSLPTE